MRRYVPALLFLLLPAVSFAQLPSGVPITVTQPPGTGGGGGIPGNPTATAGPTAIIGSATTYMRSDDAPAVQSASNAQLGLAQGDGQTVCVTTGIAATCAADNTFTANHTIAATDMGGQVNMNGSSLTVTIPAISSTVLAAHMSVIINNLNASALTISSTPTINGFNGTSIPQYGAIACVSNGTSLDCVGLGILADTATLSGAQTFTGTKTFGSVIGGVNAQSGTTYTLQASDCGKTVVATNASAITVTTFQGAIVGCDIVVEQGGAGQITFANGGAATLVSAHSYTKTFNAKGATVNLFVDVNAGSGAQFILSGDGA